MKYERILPYLSPDDTGMVEDLQWKRRWGLGFGQDFLQKFIQLPFRVPEPNPEKYDEFIKTISAPPKSSAPVSREVAPKAPESRAVNPISGTNLPAQINTPAEIPMAPAPKPAEVQARRERELQFQGDSDKVRAVALMVAETLGRNPRRLKQFVNLFRLQAYIVNEIGLFDHGHGGTPPVTLEQLGKFVAIGLRWPGLLADFAEDPTLLGILEEFADGDPRTRAVSHNRWLGESRMQKFLIYGIEKQKKIHAVQSDIISAAAHLSATHQNIATNRTTSGVSLNWLSKCEDF